MKKDLRLLSLIINSILLIAIASFFNACYSVNISECLCDDVIASSSCDFDDLEEMFTSEANRQDRDGFCLAFYCVCPLVYGE